MPDPVVEMRAITKRFGDGPSSVTAVDAIDFELARGEFVAICGESGSGKTSLLQIAGCLDRPTSGSYRLGGEDVSRLSDRELARVRNRRIGFVFQSFHLLQDRSALENVRLPLDYRESGGDPPSDPAAILERVGLAQRARHRPSELSGGERQRVAIARALVKRPEMILCDEPTGNLDSRTGTVVLDLLIALQREEAVSLLLVTHSEAVASRADRVLTMRDGRWVS
jgi:ABC-type lipoprotein export system ATPase subunit